MSKRLLAFVSAALVCASFYALAQSPVLAQTDIEPNDTFLTALQLTLPNFSTFGTVESYKDLDYYKFTGTAGFELTIWLRSASIGSELIPILALYDGSEKLIAYNDREFNLGTYQSSEDPILYVKLPSSGTYYILVTSAARFKKQSSIQSGTSGKYILGLFPRFDSPAIGDRYEPNDAQKTAYPVSLPFESYGSNLVYFGDIDWYRLAATKGQKISIDIDALENSAKPGFELAVRSRIGLFDANGRMLASSEAGRDPDTGYQNDPAIIYEVTRDGTYYIAVTAFSDTKFVTAFLDDAFLVDPYLSSTIHSIGYYQLRIDLVRDLYFPQIANGSFGSAQFGTSIILVNPSATRISTGSASFYKSDGSPMVVSLTSGGDPSSRFWFSIPSKGSVVLQTNGVGMGTSGYAIITATGPIGGSAVFSLSDGAGNLVTEAGVGPATPLDFLALPVDVTGEFNTGVAVANAAGKSAANLYLKLVASTGQVAATKSMSLGAGKHFALFVGGIDQLFSGISNFRGSLQILADTPVTAIALRSSAQTLTTLPVVPINQPFEAVVLHFPQVVVGTSSSLYRSTIILTNPGYLSIGGSILFTSSDGRPMPVQIGARVSANHTFSLAAQNTLFLEASAPSGYSTGYAVLTADHSLGGVIVYSQFERSTGKLQTEVGVPPAPLHADFFIFAQSDALYNTGLALANPGVTSASVNYRLQTAADPPEILQKGPIGLDAAKQRAELISGADQLFPSFTGFGTLEVISTQPLPAITLRVTRTTLTSLPVIPIP